MTQEEDATEMVDMTQMPDFSQPPPQQHDAAPLVIGSGSMGDTGDFEASTQFVNIADLAAGPPAGPGPGPGPGQSVGVASADATQMVDINAFQSGPVVDHGGGGEESTQFVQLEALQQGAMAPQGSNVGAIEQDPMLRNHYQFGAQDIQRFGQHTLIFAQNTASGQAVVLKRIWEGDPSQMPGWMRQRVQQLENIRHPKLAAMNGSFVSNSGAWVELQRPPGARLTNMLQQQGPQPEAVIFPLMTQAIEVIETVHANQVLYANLTTDAIWVNEGQVMLEPFDALMFEHRGDLGPYGAPEMRMPPEQRPVTPATDVYSLAMVTIASCKGAPDPSLIAHFGDASVQTALAQALEPNFQARAGDFSALKAAMGGGKAAKAGPNIDPKQLILGAVTLIALLGVGSMFLPSSGNQGQAENPSASLPQRPEVPQKEPKTSAPGKVVDDERIAIVTSYQFNPPSEDDQDGSKEEIEQDLDKAAELVKEAKDKFNAAKKYSKNDAREEYRNAMFDLRKAVDLEGTYSEENRALLAEFLARGEVLEYWEERNKLVEERLLESNEGGAATAYRTLTAINPEANSIDFFEKNKKFKVELIKGGGSSAEDE